MAPTSLANSYDGLAPFNYPSARKELQTYYRIFGSLKSPSDTTPLIVIHGGPGLSYDYLLPNSYLTEKCGIPVIFYDQIGSGRSTHLPEAAGKDGEKEKDGEKKEGFWTDEIFLEQLSQLVVHLGVEGRYDVLGHSWGGMLASRFASRRPVGLRKLILCNSAASKRASLENRWKFRREMSKEHQEVLDRGDKEGRDNEEYKMVMEVFGKGHVCNVDAGEDWGASAKFAGEDETVAEAMGDNSFWESSGYMKTWDTGEESKNINAPTLVINGIKEFASGDAVKPFLDSIPDVRLVTLEGTTHSPHFERKEAYMDVVAGFLGSG